MYFYASDNLLLEAESIKYIAWTSLFYVYSIISMNIFESVWQLPIDGKYTKLYYIIYYWVESVLFNSSSNLIINSLYFSLIS